MPPLAPKKMLRRAALALGAILLTALALGQAALPRRACTAGSSQPKTLPTHKPLPCPASRQYCILLDKNPGFETSAAPHSRRRTLPSEPTLSVVYNFTHPR